MDPTNMVSREAIDSACALILFALGVTILLMIGLSFEDRRPGNEG